MQSKNEKLQPKRSQILKRLIEWSRHVKNMNLWLWQKHPVFKEKLSADFVGLLGLAHCKLFFFLHPLTDLVQVGGSRDVTVFGSIYEKYRRVRIDQDLISLD